MSALGESKSGLPAKGHVRFTPESGHVQCNSACPLSANSGHRDGHWRSGSKAAARGRITLISVNSPGCVSTSIEPAMLLDDDVVTDGEAKPGALSGRLGRKERVEHLFFHVRRNTSAVVTDSDFHTITEVFGRGSKGRLVVAAICFRLALGRCIEAVQNKVQQRPCDVLREYVGFTGRRIKRPFQRDIEALLLGPRPVLGKVEALLNEGVDIDRPMLTRTLARV